MLVTSITSSGDAYHRVLAPRAPNCRVKEMNEMTNSQHRSAGTLLIVSDEGLHRQVLAAMAQSCGWNADIADSIDKPVSLFARKTYDVVLCKDTVPNGDPRFPIGRLRRAAGHTSVIVVSRTDNWDDYLTALAAGADPPYPAEVEQALEAAAHSRIELSDAA